MPYFLKRFFRNILKQKHLLVLNILCLALGFAAFIVLMRYVGYEISWDSENPNYDRIYRVNWKVKYQDYEKEFTQTYYPLARELKNEVPEIEESVIVKPIWDEYLSIDGSRVVLEKKGFYASENVFSVFPYKILDGDKGSMLAAPNSMVITKSLANKLFPGQNPLGQSLFNGQKSVYTITGIMEDVPENRQVCPSYLISAITEEKRLDAVDSWSQEGDYFIYLLLRQPVDLKRVEEKINTVFREHKDKSRQSLCLRPLSKLHLEQTSNSDEKYVPIYYSILATLILLLACVNFMNLLNISSGNRSKEIGILKISGSKRSNLIFQFLGEGALLSVFALSVAVLLVKTGLPVFNQIVQRSITVDFTNHLLFYILIIGITLLTGILSAVYPAFALSSYNPVKTLKAGANVLKNSKATGHRVLVIFQFFLATGLISTSFWVYNQVNYMKNKDLGFDPQDLIVCKLPGNGPGAYSGDIRNELLSNPMIGNVSISHNIPFHGNWTSEISDGEKQTGEGIFSNLNQVSYEFIDTYGMKIVAGRNFADRFRTDNSACIINESCAKALSWDDPLGKTIRAFGYKYQVIGVVKDFHQSSVYDRINPYFMVLNDAKFNKGVLTIKASGNRKDVVAFVDKTLKANISHVLIRVEDFDSTIEDVAIQIWKSVERIFLFFTLLTIGIALFGLYALVSITIKSRTKEIGIRKVQGSTAMQVFYLINKGYLILLAIAVILALPLSNVVASVSPGAYKYQLHWFDHLLVIFAIYFIALLTSGWQSWRAPTRNPVEALKYA